jgi:hypothetical protein
MKYFVILLVLIGFFTSSALAFEPSYANYFSNPEFKIYKIQENTYEFSIPYKISNAELDKIDIDCDSTELIVYLDKVEVDGNFIINIPRTLLDMKINDKDYEFIVIIDNLETEYQETYTDLDSRTLDISLRSDSKILEIIATNTGMFPEPIPCAIGSSDESSYYRLMSPLKQFKSGIPIDKIQCKENLVLIQKQDGAPACVKPETKEKLIIRGWNNVSATYDYTIKMGGVTYGSQYSISGGTVDEIIYDKDRNSLFISLDGTKQGYIQIVIQTGLLHHPRELPFNYIVIIDGKEIEFEQLSPVILRIPFEKEDQQIEIVGTIEN